MQFTSTGDRSIRIECRQAILSAYAPDGGLLLPAEIPQISREELQQLADLSYIALMVNIMSRFLKPIFTPEELQAMLADMPEKFASKEEMVPLHEIKVANDLKVQVAELYHGPSLAFKDLATIPACRLMDACLAKPDSPQKRALVTISTSGDTGASVSAAVSGLKRLDALVLLPGGGKVAKIQERQTITWPDANAHVFEGDATSDELDILAGKLQEGSSLCDPNMVKLAKERGFLLTSLNSLNPIRVLAQLIPFFYAYLRICPKADGKVCFVLPTGGGGNLSAGLLARKMGLPIEFVVALNANASVLNLLQHSSKCDSAYDVPLSVPTLAPAMDMGIPYNLPRIVNLSSQTDGEPGVAFSADPSTGHQKVTLKSKAVTQLKKALFGIESSSDEEIVETMRQVASQNAGYTVCPHSATAVNAARKAFAVKNASRAEFAGVVAMATASPCKFVEALERAGLYETNVEAKKLVERLNSMPVRAHFLKKEPTAAVPFDEWFKEISAFVTESVFSKGA